jgi:hypothetical protein
MQEYYSKWGSNGSGWFADNDWTYRQRFQELTEGAGKIFLGLTYAPKADERSMAYARANFLLFDQPANGGALLFEASDPEAQDPYSASWTADVGSPVGTRFQAGSAWRRNFTGGTVVVNPTSSTVTVSLGGTYSTLGGSPVSSVALGPTSGAILRTVAGTPPPAPSLSARLAAGSVQLGWSGLTGASVDVFRNGSRRATVSNTGAYSDALPRNAKGSYAYKVCVARTSTCTPTVSVAVSSGASAAVGLERRRAYGVARAVRARLAWHARRHAYAIRR